MSLFLNFNNKIWNAPKVQQDKVKENSQYYHLILAGTTDPPGYNAQCEGREDASDCKENGSYLKQVIKNMQIVEHSIKWGEHKDGYIYRLYNSYKNNKAKKKDALQQIYGLFEEAKEKKCSGWNRIKIYYTGHGANGDWCFQDGTVRLGDVINIANKYGEHFQCLRIYSQCCGSGTWCKQLEQYMGKIEMDIDIWASSLPGKSSYGSNNGSTWTRYKFNDEKQYAAKNKLKWTRAELFTIKYYEIEHMEVEKSEYGLGGVHNKNIYRKQDFGDGDVRVTYGE